MRMHKISRRVVLQGGCVILGAAPTEEPVLRFGIVTDIHHADKPEHGTRYYRESLGKLREAVTEFERARVAFVVELGDIVDAANDLATERAWLKDAVRHLQPAAKDVHYVLGNHCVTTLTKKQFLADIGRERSFYSFDRSGLRFIVLDACHRKDGVSYDAGNFDWKDSDVPAAQRDWLRREVASASGKVIVFVHQRLDIPGVHSVASAEEVRQILESSRKVFAVFQGHSHQNDYREIGGIDYCTMRAVIEGSGAESNGYSIASVYRDGRIHLKGFRAQKPYEIMATDEHR